MHVTVETVKELRYKIHMFGITINISESIFLYWVSLQETVMTDYTLKKKHHFFSSNTCREEVTAEVVQVEKEGNEINFFDLFTKTFAQARR